MGHRAAVLGELGRAQPLHVGGAPRALLAFDEDALLPGVLRAGLAGRTPATLTTEEALRADLGATRARGYAVSDGDSTVGVAALGAAVILAGLVLLDGRSLPTRGPA